MNTLITMESKGLDINDFARTATEQHSVGVVEAGADRDGSRALGHHGESVLDGRSHEVALAVKERPSSSARWHWPTPLPPGWVHHRDEKPAKHRKNSSISF